MKEQYLKSEFFQDICSIFKIPRYKNKRWVDIHVKEFFEKTNVTIPGNYDITIPNPEAAYKSLAKYGKVTPTLTPHQVEAMNMAWKFVEREYAPYMSDSRILTLDEAYSHLDLSSSSGPPFNAFKPLKRELVQDQNLKKWLAEDWTSLGACDMEWTCLFSNALKEEVRLEEKLRQNSLRTFLAGGFDAVIHGTRLFGDMNQKFYDSHLQTSSAVGLSQFHGGWDRVYDKLNRFNKGYALDESQYDSSLWAYLMAFCARFRWRCLREEERTQENLRRILVYYRNLIYTLVVSPDGEVVMKTLGNPSGSVNTIVDNTLILAALLAYAWIIKAPEEYNSFECYDDMTAKALQGDDNSWTVADEAHDFFNGVTVCEVLSDIGITTTSDSYLPRRARELDFLSAKFYKVRGRYYPLYSYDKLITTLYYSPTRKHSPATSLERASNLLMVGWFDERFRRIVRSFIDYLRAKFGHTLASYPHWNSALKTVHSDAEIFDLYLGISLYQQSCGSVEKCIKPHKNRMPARVKTQARKKTKNVRARQNQRIKVKPRPPRKPKATQARKQEPIRATKLPIEKCSLLYGKVLTNPFDNVVENPCIPDLLCVPSYKYNTVVVATMTVGTQGFGVAALCPWTMCAAGMGVTPGGVDHPLLVTTATYPYADIRLDSAVFTAGELAGHNGNGLVDISQISLGELRLVAAGIEISYIGETLTQSGAVTSLQTDGLKLVPSPTTLTTIQSNPRARVCSVSRESKCYQTYFPTDSRVMGYARIQDYMASTTNSGNNHPLLLVVSGAKPGSQFQVRAKAYFEAQLPGMSVTPSHSDPVGMAKVIEFRSSLASTTPQQDTKFVLQNALRSLGSTVAKAAPYIGGAIGTMVGSPEIGLSVGNMSQKAIEALLS